MIRIFFNFIKLHDKDTICHTVQLWSGINANQAKEVRKLQPVTYDLTSSADYNRNSFMGMGKRWMVDKKKLQANVVDLYSEIRSCIVTGDAEAELFNMFFIDFYNESDAILFKMEHA